MALIDREMAIEELTKAQHSADYCKEHGIDNSIDIGMMCIVLRRLPSVQPTQEIIRCNGCLYKKICSWKNQGATFCSFGERSDSE